MTPQERAQQRERYVLRATPLIYPPAPPLDADTTQLKPVTAPLPAQEVVGRLWLLPMLLLPAVLFLIAVLVAGGVLPMAILLGVFG